MLVQNHSNVNIPVIALDTIHKHSALLSSNMILDNILHIIELNRILRDLIVENKKSDSIDF